MELIRRDTDYALRITAKLAKEYASKEAISARLMSQEYKVSYPLACKLLQKLTHAGIVESIMGPKGGFRLARDPATITLTQIIEVIQGSINVNKCVCGSFKCPLKCECGLHPKMLALQKQIYEYFNSLNLQEFLLKENENDQ